MKIFAQKVGLTHYYDDKGKHKVATVLELKETEVAKVEEKGEKIIAHYALINKKAKTIKPVIGQYNLDKPFSKITTDEIQGKISKGSKPAISDIEENDELSVESITKGKGFSGTIKRFGFKRGPKTHGSRNYRKPGSIGDTGPQRVLKGKKMPGRMGGRKITMKNVKVFKIEKDNNKIWLCGHIPGAKKSIVIIKK